MDIDWLVALTGLVVGVVVGLTGMGGGALMTPMLVLFFGIAPLAAVSSDLVAALVMKPVGGAVHLRRGTVHKGLVTWLVLGSVPAAFAGVLLLRSLGDSTAVQDTVKFALGLALLLAALSIVAKNAIALRRGEVEAGGATPAEITVRRAPTLAIGVLGGLVVGMTSVGSGSLMIVLLLLLYPRLTAGLAGRHRPGAGRPAGRLRGAGAPALRRGPARPDGLAARSAASPASTSAPGSPRAPGARRSGASSSSCSPRAG